MPARESGSTAEPSFLLITQNIGSIEGKVKDRDSVRSSKCARVDHPLGSEASNREVCELSEEATHCLEAAITDLREWIFLLSFRLQCGANVREGASREGHSAAHSSTPPCLADVIVIHFQEIGGKGRSIPLNRALGELVSTRLLPEAGWNSGLLMDDEDPKRFTALGTVIFVSKRLCPVTSMLSVPHKTYVALGDDPQTYGGSVGNLFHSGRFQCARNSRKGFLLTSLRIGGTRWSFCNCHLYHDDLNTEATAITPSRYHTQRKEGFLELISSCLAVIHPNDPLFVFGDFNTRLDGKSLVEFAKMEFDMDVVPSPKSLTCPVAFWNLFRDQKKAQNIRAQFDKEPQLLLDAAAASYGVQLGEMKVNFSPTFKLLSFDKAFDKRQPSPPREYSPNRFPAWCDRIFFNPAGLRAATQLLPFSSEKKGSKVALYNSISIPFTDHDGVFMAF